MKKRKQIKDLFSKANLTDYKLCGRTYSSHEDWPFASDDSLIQVLFDQFRYLLSKRFHKYDEEE